MEKPNDPIYFYNENEAFGFLSNYFETKLLLDEKEWISTEHYYQAQKFNYPEAIDVVDIIRNQKTCDEAKNLANSGKYKIISNWDDIKVDIMYKCVKAKFEQNEELRKQLLDTKDRHLSEHSKKDKFWGDGHDGTGLNMLGKTLMKVREELREKEKKL